MLLFLGLLILALDIWAAVDVLSMKRHTDAEKKLLWLIVIFLLPLFGLVLYIFIDSRR